MIDILVSLLPFRASSVEGEGKEIRNHNIIVQTQTGNIQRIDRNSIHYDPLGYALLFPYGEPGFQLYLPNVHGDKMSHREYYSYQLHERVDENGDEVFNAVNFQPKN